MITTIILSYAKSRCFMNSLESDISLQKCVAVHHKFIRLELWAKTLQKCFLLEVILCNTTAALVVVSGIAFWVRWISQKEPVSWGPNLNTLTACQSYRQHQNTLFQAWVGIALLASSLGKKGMQGRAAQQWWNVHHPDQRSSFRRHPRNFRHHLSSRRPGGRSILATREERDSTYVHYFSTGNGRVWICLQVFWFSSDVID